MMLREETLSEVGTREYEEPDGEFIEFIESGNNTITVLTKVNSEKAGEIDLDPSDYTVSSLKDAVKETDLTPEQAQTLLEAEKEGKGRKSAITFLEDRE